MDFFKKREISRQLDAISESEWNAVFNRCKRFTKQKLYNKTQYGAHSETELGLPAIDYYVDNAIEKLINYDWEWQFEKYTLELQIIRIINSLISTQVESFKRKKQGEDSESIVEYRDDIGFDLFDEVYDEEIDDLLNCIEKLASLDLELGIHWEGIKEGKKPREIAEIIDLPVKSIYKLNEKLVYQARTNCLN